jgi:aspartyl-tRNA(Asn)/glutamyl-tRNA(Gln) amidotransferase subunit B
MSNYRIQGATGEWEVVIGLEVHAQVTSEGQAVQRRGHRFRGGAQCAGQPGRCRDAGDAARAQPRMHPPGGAHRHGDRGADQRVEPVRPQELLLCRSAAGLPDQPALPPHRGRRETADRGGREGGYSRRQDHRDRAHPRRAGCGQADARSAPDHVLCRPQPLGRGADGDRQPPDMRSPAEAGAYVRKLRAILRYVGSCDGNMEEGSMRADVNVSVRRSRRAVRHPHRDQERQLGALRHAGDRA